ncbi:MAG: hypothetical protein V4643_12685 [Bacteroidota bacterium]
MLKNSSICLLIPYSTILSAGKKLEKGVKQALKTWTISGNYTLAFITAGSKQKTEIANIQHANTEKYILEQLPSIPANCNQFLVSFDAFHSSCKNPLSIQ